VTAAGQPEEAEPLTYAAAGVDTEAADRALELARAAVEATHGPQVLGGVGGFSGLWRLAGGVGPGAGLPGAGPADPVLAASADGVGTKLLVAQALDRHDTVGIDLVAMVVDDLVVVGARPLFVLDYLAVGRVDPTRVAAIVRGVAAGCALAGCALLGGETAEHPDALEPGAYDLAGFGVGVVERSRLLGPERVVAGDVLLGLASSGLHANGFSLVRAALRRGGIGYGTTVPELGGTVGEALLTPTRIYAPDLLALLDSEVDVHALCHVTGGGLPGNLPRCMPPGHAARVDYRAWSPPAVFELVRSAGRVADTEMARALNLGIGMVVVLPQAQVVRAAGLLEQRGIDTVVIGEVAAA
jgi:phosphoribosylformylglycinamidine cyclo-ligase